MSCDSCSIARRYNSLELRVSHASRSLVGGWRLAVERRHEVHFGGLLAISEHEAAASTRTASGPIHHLQRRWEKLTMFTASGGTKPDH
jgi:hypothetical protein